MLTPAEAVLWGRKPSGKAWARDPSGNIWGTVGLEGHYGCIMMAFWTDPVTSLSHEIPT